MGAIALIIVAIGLILQRAALDDMAFDITGIRNSLKRIQSTLDRLEARGMTPEEIVAALRGDKSHER